MRFVLFIFPLKFSFDSLYLIFFSEKLYISSDSMGVYYFLNGEVFKFIHDVICLDYLMIKTSKENMLIGSFFVVQSHLLVYEHVPVEESDNDDVLDEDYEAVECKGDLCVKCL